MSQSDGRLRAWCAVALLAVLLAGGCSGKKKGTPVLELTKDGPGTCLDVPDTLGEQVKRLPVIDCNKPHTHEIFGVEKWDKGDVFPGLEALDTFAQQKCVDAFRDYVQISNFDSSLTFTWLTPTLDSWNNHKDRTVLCVLQDSSAAPLTGSMKDSHR